MRILQDTHILLWALAEPERLGRRTRASLEDPANEIQFSAASIWEIAIKAALGRPDFSIDPDEIFKAAVTTGFVEMPVRAPRPWPWRACRRTIVTPSTASLLRRR